VAGQRDALRAGKYERTDDRLAQQAHAFRNFATDDTKGIRSLNSLVTEICRTFKLALPTRLDGFPSTEVVGDMNIVDVVDR
jgi:hypothetical protein